MCDKNSPFGISSEKNKAFRARISYFCGWKKTPDFRENIGGLKLFDWSLKLNGFPLDWAKAELQKTLDVPAENYAGFTQARARAIAEFHLKHNAFYRELTKTNQFTDWQSLPVMSKSDFQRPLTERLSDGFSKKSVFINSTSGSSGHPMVFAKDKKAHAVIWANIIRRFGWYGIDFNTSLQARFYGRVLTGWSKYATQLKDFLSKRHRFDIFDMSDPALENMLSVFAKKRFEYLNGYTTAIVQLAQYLKRTNRNLKSICPSLKICIVTSEMLFREDRKLLEKYLGVPVVNEYGASELEVIAFEAPDGRWVVNAETLFVEILDDDGNPVPAGTQGRIVVTSLYNKAHPFIRYDVGDYGILDPSGTAKNPIMQKLIGRTNDFALLPSGKKPAGMTFYSITKSLFGDNSIVYEFIIVQSAIDTFEIHYAAERDLMASEIVAIEKTLTEYLEPGLVFKFERHERIPRSANGKLKQFSSLL